MSKWLTQFTLKGSDYVSRRDREKMMEQPDDTLDRVVGPDTYACGGQWSIGPSERHDIKDALRAAYRAGMHTGEALKSAEWIVCVPILLGLGFLIGKLT